MKIATLNINSINARIANLCKWLQKEQPDILLLQELKTEFNLFPFFDLQMQGYECRVLGQKAYNGVAILSKHKLVLVTENLPNFPDENARYLECETIINGTTYTLASIYLPNGNPPRGNPHDDSKLLYKLSWMDAFYEHAQELLLSNRNVILGGDFNTILTPNDVYNPDLFKNNALFHPQVQKRLQFLLRSGYADAYRSLYPQTPGYTFWDYAVSASVQNDLGMRIDYILTSPSVTDKLRGCRIDKDFRTWEKASDHTVLIAEFED